MQWVNCEGNGCDLGCLRDISLPRIIKATNAEVCQWLVCHGLCDKVVCDKCGIDCKLSTRESRGSNQEPLAVWQCTLTGFSKKGSKLSASNGILYGLQMPHGKVLQVIFAILQGKPQQSIIDDVGLSKKGVHTILQRVLTIAQWANDNDYQNAAGTFKTFQVDETVVSKRKYNVGKRTRQGGSDWMEVEVNVSPSKKARKVFAQNVPNRTARSLLPAIDHLAAAGAEVATDALRSNASLGKSLRPDIRHKVFNHSEKVESKCFQKGVHTNHVEGMNAVLKRSTRQRF